MDDSTHEEHIRAASYIDYYCLVIRQTDLQDNGVVKADIGECPVHYHHVGVKDLPTHLQ